MNDVDNENKPHMAFRGDQNDSYSSGTKPPPVGVVTAIHHASSSRRHGSFRVGEKVIMKLEDNLIRPMQEGHGGWEEKMENIRGKVGEVHQITKRGDVKVLYDQKYFDLVKAKPLLDDFIWTFHPAALERVIDTSGSKFQNSHSRVNTSSSQAHHESLPLELGDYSLSSVEQNESMPSVELARNSIEIGTDAQHLPHPFSLDKKTNTNKTCDGKPLTNDKSLKDKISCIICMSRTVNTAFFPCKHMATCQECSENLKQCCLCRKEIFKKEEFFTSF